MTTTHDDATTWRDLACDLTAAEVTNIEGIELELGAETHGPAILLEVARNYVLCRTVDAAYSDVPLPAGATGGSGWEKNLKRDGWSRALVWRDFGDGEMSVGIDGRQQCDGSYTRRISLWGVEDGGEITSVQAREAAALLIEAADVLDEMQGL
jgi:hypothetical protein